MATGGAAKWAVQSGEVTVNGDLETRRGHRLSDRDVVAFAGVEYRVCISEN